MPASLESQKVRDNLWYYEYQNGIEVVYRMQDADGYWQSVIVGKIPLRMLKKSLRRIARKSSK